MATAGHNLSEHKSMDLPNGAHFRVGIVVSEWNKKFTEPMMQGAKDLLVSAGVQPDHIRVSWVPGSYELALGSKWHTDRDDVDGVIAIGSVIRGETAHFDYVCSSAAQGIMEVNLSSGKPVMFCVLTDDNEAQTEARSGGVHGNKGVEAAAGLLHMLALKRTLTSS